MNEAGEEATTREGWATCFIVSRVAVRLSKQNMDGYGGAIALGNGSACPLDSPHLRKQRDDDPIKLLCQCAGRLTQRVGSNG
jgi:hypothetical protein